MIYIPHISILIHIYFEISSVVGQRTKSDIMRFYLNIIIGQDYYWHYCSFLFHYFPHIGKLRVTRIECEGELPENPPGP